MTDKLGSRANRTRSKFRTGDEGPEIVELPQLLRTAGKPLPRRSHDQRVEDPRAQSCVEQDATPHQHLRPHDVKHCLGQQRDREHQRQQHKGGYVLVDENAIVDLH